jgi:hypothetical protein
MEWNGARVVGGVLCVSYVRWVCKKRWGWVGGGWIQERGRGKSHIAHLAAQSTNTIDFIDPSHRYLLYIYI